MADAPLLLFLLASAAPPPTLDAQQVMALQREMLRAADRNDRAALERGIADGFRAVWIAKTNGRSHWGEAGKARVIERWSMPTPGALPTLIKEQHAAAIGDTATVSACIVDRVAEKGRETRIYSLVADTFARIHGRWLWTFAAENEVQAC